MSHVTEQPVAVITTGNLVGGYSKQELQQAQREDSCVGEILAAKEHEERPSSQYAKGQNIPYRRLLQQWDKLIVHDGMLWRQCQPDEQQGWLQLVISRSLQDEILTEVHEGVT